MPSKSAVFLFVLLASASAQASQPQSKPAQPSNPPASVLTSEPPRGSLAPGERVLVDDGSCPAGKIKEVIGGQNVHGAGGPRQRRCVQRR